MTQSFTLYDVDLWREHASQMRALSGEITDPLTKQQTLEVAAGFDEIAQLAGKLKPKQPIMRVMLPATRIGHLSSPRVAVERGFSFMQKLLSS